MWGIIIGEFVVTVIEMAVDYWDERRQNRKRKKDLQDEPETDKL